MSTNHRRDNVHVRGSDLQAARAQAGVMGSSSIAALPGGYKFFLFLIVLQTCLDQEPWIHAALQPWLIVT